MQFFSSSNAAKKENKKTVTFKEGKELAKIRYFTEFKDPEEIKKAEESAKKFTEESQEISDIQEYLDTIENDEICKYKDLKWALNKVSSGYKFKNPDIRETADKIEIRILLKMVENISRYNNDDKNKALSVLKENKHDVTTEELARKIKLFDIKDANGNRWGEIFCDDENPSTYTSAMLEYNRGNINESSFGVIDSRFKNVDKPTSSEQAFHDFVMVLKSKGGFDAALSMLERGMKNDPARYAQILLAVSEGSPEWTNKQRSTYESVKKRCAQEAYFQCVDPENKNKKQAKELFWDFLKTDPDTAMSVMEESQGFHFVDIAFQESKNWNQDKKLKLEKLTKGKLEKAYDAYSKNETGGRMAYTDFILCTDNPEMRDIALSVLEKKEGESFLLTAQRHSNEWSDEHKGRLQKMIDERKPGMSAPRIIKAQEVSVQQAPEHDVKVSSYQSKNFTRKPESARDRLEKMLKKPNVER